MRESFTLRAAAHLLLFREGEVLLSRRYNTGWRDGSYSVIAGHLDGGETVLQAMIREAKEEACIDIAESDLRVVHVMHRKSKESEYIDFFLTTDTWTGDMQNGEPHKCDELAWFPLTAIPQNTLSYIQQGIEQSVAGVPYSESGWNDDAL